MAAAAALAAMAPRTASAAATDGEIPPVEAPPAPSSAPRLDLGFAVGMYQTSSVRPLAAASDYGTTVNFGSLVLTLRNGPLAVGASLAGGMRGFGPSEAFVGGHLGLAHAVDMFRVEIAAEGGVHRISDIGADLFSHSGVTVSRPYVGAHLNLGLGPSRPRRGSGGVHVSLFVRRDLGGVSTVMATPCGGLVFTSCESPQSFAIGGTSAGVALLGTINVL